MSGGSSTEAGPIDSRERIISLDVLRGFAVLGILLMNVQSFSMIGAAYLNPTAYGELTGLNYCVWYGSHLLADSKFISIFSMLFGAGILLMSDRCEQTGRSAIDLHTRRMFGLLLIGLVHAYVFWAGDILVSYAIVGMIVFWFRRLSPVTLCVLGLLSVGIRGAAEYMFGITMPHWGEASVEALRNSDWQPNAEFVEAELAAYRGDWLHQSSYRIPAVIMMQFFVLPTLIGWRVGGMMLLGMALFRWQILTGQRRRRVYRRLFWFGMAIGLPLIAWGVHRNHLAEWRIEYSMFFGLLPNYFGSVAVAIAFIGLVELIRRGRWGTRVTQWLAPVGRMALTNYLGQTLICTTLFYGHGLGLFGSVSRVEQLLIVLAVWAFQLVFSRLWLTYFKFGPAEYGWRRLTYGVFKASTADRAGPQQHALTS